jgi:hypothetical protein
MLADDRRNKTPRISRELTNRAFSSWEERLFGSNSISGPIRLIACVLVVALVVGAAFAILK